MSTNVLRPRSAGTSRRGPAPAGLRLRGGPPAEPLATLAPPGHPGCAQVGPPRGFVRLRDRRPPSSVSPVRLRGSNFGPVPPRGDGRDGAQISQITSDRNRAPARARKRNLPEFLSSGEEDAGPMARLPRCQAGQRVPTARALQDGGTPDGASAHSPRRLDDDAGHHRGVPSPPPRPFPAQVLSLRLEGSPLPVPHALLRRGTGTSTFHQGPASGDPETSSCRDSLCPLPGRHFDSRAFTLGEHTPVTARGRPAQCWAF